MKKIKLLKFISMSCLPIFLGATAISCGNSDNSKIILRINSKKGWAKFDLSEYEKNLEDIINKEAKKQWIHKKFDVVFDNSFGDDKAIMNNILSNKADLGFSSITQINLSKDQKDKFDPVIQTLTNSFTFDQDWTMYSDGSESDKLLEQATKETKAFTEDFPYQSNTSWNGSIYTNYYNLGKQVDFYRGMIWIYGSENEILNIIKAWKDKDWSTFKSFGILYGDSSSGGKFKLQEKLLKKHFPNSFTTLEEEILKTPKKFKNEKAKNITKTNDYHIAFDDNGSFAYTANSDDNGAEDSSEPFKVSDPNKLKILTVTEPLKYDIGIFNSDFLFKNIVASAFNKLGSKDLYGPTYGYNGYSIIDVDRQDKEVYNKFSEVID